VGTATVFLDLVFGFAPATLGFVAEATDYRVTFLVSAAFAALAAALLVARRESLERPVALVTE
jgi:hypothetical protein